VEKVLPSGGRLRIRRYPAGTRGRAKVCLQLAQGRNHKCLHVLDCLHLEPPFAGIRQFELLLDRAETLHDPERVEAEVGDKTRRGKHRLPLEWSHLGYHGSDSESYLLLVHAGSVTCVRPAER